MTNTRIRYRSVVITIQQFAIFKQIRWHLIPKLVRVTMQLEDKDPDGTPTNKMHIQAYLEFSDQIGQSTLAKHLPNVHLPTALELANLKRKFPNGMKPEQGRFYCSNPVKRIEHSIPCIWENGVWIEGADFLQALITASEHEEKIFELPEKKMRNSYFIKHKGELVEVIQEGTERLRPLSLSLSEPVLSFERLMEERQRMSSLVKLRKNN